MGDWVNATVNVRKRKFPKHLELSVQSIPPAANEVRNAIFWSIC